MVKKSKEPTQTVWKRSTPVDESKKIVSKIDAGNVIEEKRARPKVNYAGLGGVVRKTASAKKTGTTKVTKQKKTTTKKPATRSATAKKTGTSTKKTTKRAAPRTARRRS
jgi:topoisomerase IA-like protein